MADILMKVRGLLAKAEATEFEAERDAFLSKATELMERHAITEAQLEALGETTVREPIEVAFPQPKGVGMRAFDSLLVEIARTNRCQAIGAHMYRRKDTGDEIVDTKDLPKRIITRMRRPRDVENQILFDEEPQEEQVEVTAWELVDRLPAIKFQGMPEDAQFCALLATSLELQMQTLHDEAKIHKAEWESWRTFKANFCEAFGGRVRTRLKDLACERRVGWEGGTELVLANVQERVEAKFGKVRYSSRRVNINRSESAQQAGRRAGDKADLSGGSRRQMQNRAQIQAGA